MTKLSDLLKNTLDGVSKDFNTALADLNAVIDELATAVSDLRLPKPVKIQLYRQATVEKSAIYSVAMIMPDGELYHIASFSIPLSGYPILRGGYSVNNGWWSNGTINDAEGLRAFFTNMLQNRSSSLVVQLAFLLNDT